MNLAAIFRPKSTISQEELAKGLRWLTWQGVVSMGFGSIFDSGFLAAYALALGANNLQIGILAAIPPLTQPLQIPTISLVEWLRRRKGMTVAAWFGAQCLWIPIALIPVLLKVPGAPAVSLLLGMMSLRGVLAALFSCAWNSWLRDLVPQEVLGRFFAQRQMWANVAAMAFGLGAALFVDLWKGHTGGEREALGYTFALLAGALTLGLSAPMFILLIPEPLMPPRSGPQPSFFSMLAAPFRDHNFLHLLRFKFLWGLALNLATPFFAVYMLRRLGLPLSLVIGFSVVSQMSNVLFLRIWGPLVDRFSNKTILSACASLYLLVVLGWAFTTMPERYFLTIPLLVVLHILAGIASAGVSLTTGTIGMKLAPQGQATAYLAVASLAVNAGSGLGPLLGGRLADFFSVRSLSLHFAWAGPTGSIRLPVMDLTGFDFLFGIAFLLGLITLNGLTALREEGEVSREVVLDALLAPAREFSRPMSSVPGLNFLSHFPYGYLRRAPIPGLDVAFGVTAYQIAEVARIATTARARSRGMAARAVAALEHVMTRAWKAAERLKACGSKIARRLGWGRSPPAGS